MIRNLILISPISIFNSQLIVLLLPAAKVGGISETKKCFFVLYFTRLALPLYFETNINS